MREPMQRPRWLDPLIILLTLIASAFGTNGLGAAESVLGQLGCARLCGIDTPHGLCIFIDFAIPSTYHIQV